METPFWRQPAYQERVIAIRKAGIQAIDWHIPAAVESAYRLYPDREELFNRVISPHNPHTPVYFRQYNRHSSASGSLERMIRETPFTHTLNQGMNILAYESQVDEIPELVAAGRLEDMYMTPGLERGGYPPLFDIRQIPQLIDAIEFALLGPHSKEVRNSKRAAVALTEVNRAHHGAHGLPPHGIAGSVPMLGHSVSDLAGKKIFSYLTGESEKLPAHQQLVEMGESPNIRELRRRERASRIPGAAGAQGGTRRGRRRHRQSKKK